ncbi:putative Peptidoglycan binding-like domain-containing protein [uncultured Gammaproteobacteria bacterium]
MSSIFSGLRQSTPHRCGGPLPTSGLFPAAVLLALVVVVVVVAMGMTPMPAAAAGAGDLQWAQTVLKEKGFDPGRPNGQMTDKTHAALSAYQKASGLPVTGALDDKTTQHLLQSRPTSSSVHTLGAPDTHRPRPSGAAAIEPKPHAAPTQRVDSSGGGDSVLGASALRPLGPSPSRAGGGDDGPKPMAAPRTAVGAETTQTGTGTIGAPLAEASEPPNWARYGILGMIFATLFGAGWRWWRSGRPGASAINDDGHDRDRLRLEPTFAPPAPPPPGRDFRARRL